MQHSFYLNKKSVSISVTHGGYQFRRATGLIIADKSLWDSKAVSLKAKCKDKRILPDVLTIHSRLSEREVSARTYADVRDAIEYALDWAGQKREREKIVKPATNKIPTFWEYFQKWANRPSSSQRQRALAMRVIQRLMGKRENWNDIDSAYWFKLQRKMEDEGFSVNYRWNIGARLKVVMHEGFKLKYHHNDDFSEFSSKKEQTEAIALTADEIELLWALKTQNKMYQKCRDLGLIGYYSASRFSDYSRLSLDNIRDGKLEFIQKKTGDKVILPASPRLVELLERNGGRAPLVDQVVFNRNIKFVAREAGIDGVVHLSKSRQKKDGSPTYRWECVMSHTFRRSAATALYLSGVSLKDIMAVTGHRSLSSLERYLRISKEESVARLEKVGFFK